MSTGGQRIKPAGRCIKPGDPCIEPVDSRIKQPFWGKCVECRHVWIMAYMPLEIGLFAKVVGKAYCPMCGADPRKIKPAKQDKGKLQEPAAT